MKQFLLCLTIFAGVALAGRKPPQKLKLEVYTESLCKYSTRFLRDQVLPLMSDMHKYIDLTVVAFGHAECKIERDSSNPFANGKTVCECQHGEAECNGNTMQACVQRVQPNDQFAIPVIVCIQGAETHDELMECIDENQQASKLRRGPLMNCYNRPLGKRLLVANGKKTEARDFKTVPHIVINGESNSDWDSKTDLRGVICDLIDYPIEQCEKLD